MSLTVKVPSQFTYQTIAEFVDSYDDSIDAGQIKKLILDFSEVEKVDSSAMLKLVKLGHRAQQKDIEITIQNVSVQMAKKLNLSSLERLGYTILIE